MSTQTPELGPCCATCIHYEGCVHASTTVTDPEHEFCSRWATKEPAPKGPDPNELWRTGDGDAP